MRLLYDERNWALGQSAIALGMFDGVHLGHVSLVKETVRLARTQGLSSVVVTFSNHPMSVVLPQAAPPLLTTAEEKIERLERLQPDALVIRPFDAALATLPADDYVAHLLQTLRPREIVVGFNYTFGARGAGDAALLVRLGKQYGFSVRVLEPVCWRGEPVSSSRIRASLAAGDMQAVRAMMGDSYAVTGTVVHGKQLGRTLGFPTANLELPLGKAMPPFGVYAAQVLVEGTPYFAVLNIGAHPTAPEGAPTIEVHLLDAQVDLYEKRICAQLVSMLRPERTFPGLDALREQIARDAQAARDALHAVVGGQ